MKNYDIVKLIALTDEFKLLNLYVGIHGIIIKSGVKQSKVLFLNDNNLGEKVCVEVNNSLLKKENETLPQKFLNIIEQNLSMLNKDENKPLSKPKFKEVDFVEVVVEKEKYIKQGVHLGYRGFVVNPEVIKNEILVDFTGVNEKGEIYGDFVNININDLKIVDE